MGHSNKLLNLGAVGTPTFVVGWSEVQLSWEPPAWVCSEDSQMGTVPWSLWSLHECWVVSELQFVVPQVHPSLSLSEQPGLHLHFQDFLSPLPILSPTSTENPTSSVIRVFEDQFRHM